MSTPNGLTLGKPISVRLLLLFVVENNDGVPVCLRLHTYDDVIVTVGPAKIGLNVKFGTVYTRSFLLSHFIFGGIGEGGDLGCD